MVEFGPMSTIYAGNRGSARHPWSPIQRDVAGLATVPSHIAVMGRWHGNRASDNEGNGESPRWQKHDRARSHIRPLLAFQAGASMKLPAPQALRADNECCPPSIGPGPDAARKARPRSLERTRAMCRMFA